MVSNTNIPHIPTSTTHLLWPNKIRGFFHQRYAFLPCTHSHTHTHQFIGHSYKLYIYEWRVVLYVFRYWCVCVCVDNVAFHFGHTSLSLTLPTFVLDLFLVMRHKGQQIPCDSSLCATNFLAKSMVWRTKSSQWNEIGSDEFGWKWEWKSEHGQAFQFRFLNRAARLLFRIKNTS